MNQILSLFIFLLVLSNTCLAQSQGDSSLPPPPQDTARKATVVHHRIADSLRPVRKATDSSRAAGAAAGIGATTGIDTSFAANDTTHYPVTNDSTRPRKPAPVVFELPRSRLHYLGVLRLHPYFNFFASPIVRVSEERQVQGKETLFYLLMGMLFCLALIKVVFARYVNNLLALVFRASMKQKQIREQLQQTPLPSLLLNIFFVLVAGLYVVFILQHYRFIEADDFWIPFFSCSLVIAIVYIIKFTILKFTGWVFNMREAANTYAFIVFLVNKLLGMFLLPLLILISFSRPSWATPLRTLSYVLIFCFFAYRYIVSFSPVRREVKVSPFHFFMYLCAFEIAPLLLIYKVLLRIL